MDETQRDPSETLAAERAMLRTLVDWVPDLLYLKDVESRFLVSNRALLSTLGAEREAEVLGKTDFDLFPREFAERYFADEEEILRTGQPMVGRVEPVVDKDNRKGWLLTAKAPVRDAEGRITAIVGMGRDITAQKLAEHALAIERDLVRTLMDAVPDYIYYKDTDGHFVCANRAYTERLGLPSTDQVVGKSDVDFFDEAQAEAARASERAIMQTGTPVIDVEERHLDREGRTRWVSTTKVPLRDDEGHVLGVLGISRDITERKWSEERLMRCDKMASLGRLTAGIAHEMNTPLAAARAGVAELSELIREYQEGLDDPAISLDDHRAIGKEMRAALAIADTALQRAASFVRGIKTQTRDLAQGERRRFDAVRAIREGLLLLEHAFKARGCILTFEPSRDDIELMGSPGRLVQLLSNLVVNAVDACAGVSHGRILVTLTDGAGVTELRVCDNGAGIHPRHIAKIFEPMFTTKPFGEGTGLGLTIVYDIVVGEFGGSIDVQSEPGQGTTFVIRFPKP